MNLLRGRVARGGAGPRFEGPVLATDLAGYPFRDAPAEGAEVVLGVRPEQVRVAREVSAATPYAAKVAVVEPLGPQKIVWFECQGEMLSSIVDDQWAGVPGDAVAFGFDLPRTSLFDAKSEARL
jgi:multiple sugar transport system ATP-binding protein